jgi:hypothetical protein
MTNSNNTPDMPRFLVLIAVLVSSAWVMPGAAGAAETQYSKSRFAQLLDGDVQLAPVGQRAGLHMTFKSPSDTSDAFNALHADHHGFNSTGIHLSVRMPWK